MPKKKAYHNLHVALVVILSENTKEILGPCYLKFEWLTLVKGEFRALYRLGSNERA